MRRTVTIFLALVLTFVSIGLASAEKFKQTSTPKLGHYAKVFDPATGLPLIVEGPDGQPIECSADQVPIGATVRVYWLTNANGRHTVKLTAREKDGSVEQDIVGGPYYVDYLTKTDYIGPHVCTASIWTDEERWDPAVEEYTVISKTLEQARFKPRVITAPPGTPIPPGATPISPQVVPVPDADPPAIPTPAAPPVDPLMGLKLASREQILTCTYDRVNRVQLGDQIVVKVRGQVVGLLEVTRLDRFGYNAILVAGEAPVGAELYLRNGGQA